MGDLPPSSHTPPPPTAFPKSNMPMLYYGLVIVGMSAIMLTLYNLIILRWCSELTNHQRYRQRVRRSAGPTLNKSFHVNYVYSFKYKEDGFVQDEDDECECVVCLSVFEEGEELRQLPKCKHFFHASCIDMWLFSHMDCPLCRSPGMGVASYTATFIPMGLSSSNFILLTRASYSLKLTLIPQNLIHQLFRVSSSSNASPMASPIASLVSSTFSFCISNSCIIFCNDGRSCDYPSFLLPR